MQDKYHIISLLLLFLFGCAISPYAKIEKPANAILVFNESGGIDGRNNELIILNDFTFIYHKKKARKKYNGHVPKKQEIQILELIKKYNEIYWEKRAPRRGADMLGSSWHFWGNGVKKEMSEEDQQKLRSILRIIINTSRKNRVSPWIVN